MSNSCLVSKSASGAGDSASTVSDFGHRRLSEGLRAALAACECRSGRGLTRSEFAFIFGVTARTVARWEDRYCLPAERKNARVLLYAVESVVMLCAAGYALNRERTFEVDLVPDAILALAAKHCAEMGARVAVDAKPLSPVLIATTDDERCLIRLWNDPVKREGLRVLIHALSA